MEIPPHGQDCTCCEAKACAAGKPPVPVHGRWARERRERLLEEGWELFLEFDDKVRGDRT